MENKLHLLKFEKEYDNRWYIVLPKWEGSKEDLEMVCGADTLLDILSQGENLVYITVSESQYEGYKYMLAFNKEEAGGVWYDLVSLDFSFEVWLCSVTKSIFGDRFPEKLYFN